MPILIQCTCNFAAVTVPLHSPISFLIYLFFFNLRQEQIHDNDEMVMIIIATMMIYIQLLFLSEHEILKTEKRRKEYEKCVCT